MLKNILFCRHNYKQRLALYSFLNLGYQYKNLGNGLIKLLRLLPSLFLPAKNRLRQVFVSPFWTLEYCIGLSEKLAPILFEAIKQAGQEMTDDGQPGKTVTEDWDAFSNSKTQEQIAFGLYHEFIGGGKNISKSIIAQRFTILFERDTSITKEDLEQDENISYLIKAVKYASN